MNNTQLKRMKSICKIVIALHIAVFVLLVFNFFLPFLNTYVEYQSSGFFEIIFDFLKMFKKLFVSASFLPSWLSAIFITIILAVKITDFIVTFMKVSKGEHKYKEYKEKYKALHIVGLFSTPLWFIMLNYFGFNCGIGCTFYAFVYNDIQNVFYTYPFLYTFLIPSIIICVLLVALDLAMLRINLKNSALVVSMIVIFMMSFLPSVCDILIYGPNIKESLIKQNQQVISSTVNHDNNLSGCPAEDFIIGEVNVKKTAETVKFDWREVSFEYTFKDEKTQEEYMIKVKGERLWFGKYRWRIIRSGLD